jgi:hypothetical protein
MIVIPEHALSVSRRFTHTTVQVVSAARQVNARLLAAFDAINALLVARGRWVTSAFDLRDLFVFSGLGAAWYGLSQVSSPAAWVVVGVALFWLGVRK